MEKDIDDADTVLKRLPIWEILSEAYAIYIDG